jgi:ABC-type dipeptide/oligopeptide/nickel transport system permease subunit
MADRWPWALRALPLLVLLLNPGDAARALRSGWGEAAVLLAGTAVLTALPYRRLAGRLGGWEGRLGGLLFLALVGGAVYAPLLAPHDPNAQFQPAVCRYLGPGSSAWQDPATEKFSLTPSPGARRFVFPLGTDGYGRCVLSRVLAGGRVSLAIGLLSVLLTLAMGVLVGGTAGYYGGWVDAVLMRLVDTLLAFPRLFLLLLLAGILEKQLSILGIVLILGALSWMEVARLVRGQVLSLKERDFVTAARAIGASDARILGRHILPHLAGLLLIDATLRIGGIILTEAALSFLGLGVQPPNASWGNIIADGKEALTDGWWVSACPGLAMLLTVFSLYLMGESGMKRPAR